MNKPLSLLGGLTAEVFLAEFWQKKPLLVRQAVTDVGEWADRAVLSELAERDDVESRVVSCFDGRWRLKRGPFSADFLRRLPERDWSLLVQGVNHHLPQVSDLLWKFNFVPFARLDDLMVSFAPEGGTVGPHFDSYDVFLLQVGGRKRWQISSAKDVPLIEDAPLKILQSFDAEQSWELEHGDMLYLPPRYAHYGVALEAGMTYSIGFRAPSAQELIGGFLEYLQEQLCVDGRYADPDLVWQARPAEIGAAMVEQVEQMFRQIQWSHTDVRQFLGRYLTEPKAHIFFDAPHTNLSDEVFELSLMESGIRLDLKTLLLFDAQYFYVNGEAWRVPTCDTEFWQTLANTRYAHGAVSAESVDLLREGFDAGFWHLG